jgi:hypothetical protein
MSDWAIHHYFLQNILPELFQVVDLQPWIYLWFMHECALPHFVLTLRAFLKKVFAEGRIGLVEQQQGLLVYQI